MGTIHTVIWMENLDDVDLMELGAEISNHSVFQEKTNVNMVQVLDSRTLKLMTYERGVGDDQCLWGQVPAPVWSSEVWKGNAKRKLTLFFHSEDFTSYKK